MAKRDSICNLYAIADLHSGRPQTWSMLQNLPNYNNDWIILAGDVCDGWSENRFTETLNLFKHRFAKVFWTCGNHELYSLNNSKDKYASLRGVAKYERMVQLCNNAGVITPEDPFEKWTINPSVAKNVAPSLEDDIKLPEETESAYICPIFTLYDYSFRPESVSREDCLNWAQKSKVMCTDEFVLHPDPYLSRDDWCNARVEYTEGRLNKLLEEGNPSTVLASHFSLRYDMVYSPYLPRFSIWCGTKKTENWHVKYNAKAVVFGHTHVRNTTSLDNCQFYECSLGYPNQYSKFRKISEYLCHILPTKTYETCTIN